MEEANRFLSESFIEDFNGRFAVAAAEEGSAFVPLLGVGLDDILCLKNRRVVGNDNCVRYRGMSLQIPPVKDRYHFVRAKVTVHEYEDGSMGVFHEGKRWLGVITGRGIRWRKPKREGRWRRGNDTVSNQPLRARPSSLI